jgi:hypothetical protein
MESLMMDDLAQMEERQRRETETILRIHQLVKQGYRINWSGSDVEALWFEHRGKGPSLIFYPSGKIVSQDKSVTLNPLPKADHDRIYNDATDDAQLFDRWLRSVPLPSWRELAVDDIIKLMMSPISLILVIVAFVGIWPIIKLIWNAVVGP